ncbi:MAG: pyrroline-5-carboxylate reductase, partial [Kangiellaceae bacterium]|nr:pyrroline-5-carboxylate reductase [Kangiellaceae bacterium]
LHEQYGLHITNNNREAAEFADIVVLAVKPQKMPDVLPQLSHINFADKFIISVAAGYMSTKIETGLDQSVPIIRAMPNTPALIKLGATGMFATSKVNTEQKQVAQSIFEAIGETVWVEKESQIDIVTAIAGSSPAYAFLFMQAIIDQAVANGLSEEKAFKLVTQAISGAAQLAQAQTDKSLEILRKEVTSPGGTTAAAISSFKNDDFENIVKKAVSAAVNRGRELGK